MRVQQSSEKAVSVLNQEPTMNRVAGPWSYTQYCYCYNATPNKPVHSQQVSGLKNNNWFVHRDHKLKKTTGTGNTRRNAYLSVIYELKYSNIHNAKLKTFLSSQNPPTHPPPSLCKQASYHYVNKRHIIMQTSGTSLSKQLSAIIQTSAMLLCEQTQKKQNKTKNVIETLTKLIL